MFGYPNKPKPQPLELPVGGQILGSPLYVSKDEYPFMGSPGVGTPHAHFRYGKLGQ